VRITWSLPVRSGAHNPGRGDEVRAHSLIKALRADGHYVSLVEGAPPLNGTSRLLHRALPSVQSWTHARRVAAAAKQQRADLIIETQVHCDDSGARAARIAGVPLVLDDCSPTDDEWLLGSGLQRLARRTLRRQAAAATVVFVSSGDFAERLARDGVPKEKIRVVPDGIDAKAHVSARAGRARARQRMGAREACIAAFVGTFQPWHDTELLVRAVAGMAGGSGLRVLLAGDGPTLQPTLRLAEALGVLHRFTSLGFIPATEVPRVLAASDIGVLTGTNPSGRSMKLLDYAAAGLPTVAVDLPSVRAWVEPGRNGLLFSPGDSGALARALERLLRDPGLRRALGDLARERVHEVHDWTSRARALLAAGPLGPTLSPARTAAVSPGDVRTTRRPAHTRS
jgi:glycosyltransferase involved in cell wall biosynthesis